MNIQYVVSSHMKVCLSGVAKFNALLGQKLNVPCWSLEQVKDISRGPVLFSLKVKDITSAENALIYESISHLLGSAIEFDVFFHTFANLDVEQELVRHCRKVYCGNKEIQSAIEVSTENDISDKLQTVWCPPLINSDGVLHESALNVFSFGMAHKIQIKQYRRLGEFLNKSGVNYSLWVSTAFHEKASFGDFDVISNEMRDIFGDHIQFLGFLSDDAVNYFLKKAQLFVAFFEKGVRSNNTSVLGAMRNGCAPVVNYDEFSPTWMRHGENILDIHKIEGTHLDSTYLEKLGCTARRDVKKHSSWDALLETLETIESFHVIGEKS